MQIEYFFSANAKYCKFSESPATEFGPSYLGWMYPKNSMLKWLFDQYMIKSYEDGLYEKMTRRTDVTCHSNGLYVVDFKFVGILFGILSSGIIFSIIFLAFENISKYIQSLS